jgi:EAL domain-containing protein (putative c-di-GMP-specific phosphodiesterase class I)
MNFPFEARVGRRPGAPGSSVDVRRRALAGTGACIELDFTESMAMEEPQQLARMLAEVKRTGVSLAQGYLFARPLSPEGLLAWLERQQANTA